VQILRLFFCSLLLGFTAVVGFSAETLPSKPAQYFNDYARLVSPQQAGALNQRLEQFERETSNQLIVAIFPRMESASSVEDYTVRIAQSWGVGQKGHSNGAVLFLPDGKMHRYVKTHLPELGLDKFVVTGSDLPVFDTSIGRIGIAICFDLRPPEPIRVLALKGAELIVLPTNWPEGADFAPAHMAAVRANEIRVFLAACDRVGMENGFRFIGKSGIWDVAGKCLASAGDGEETIVADVDLAQAREKRVRIIPGKYETTILESRRPELYGEITGGA